MSRARQVANFDPALLAADEVSLDKVNGGTLGTGTIGGSSIVNTSGAITTTGTLTSGEISSSHTFSATIANNTMTTIYDLGTIMESGDSAVILLTKVGHNVAARIHVIADPSGYAITVDTQRIGYIGSFAMSGSNVQVSTSISASTQTITGRVIIMKGYNG